MDYKVIKEGQITKPEDFADLRLVDWNRWYHGNLYGAQQNMPKWLIGCWYTVVECDLSKEPLRPGFTWGHQGEAHHELGHRYWSFFKRMFPGGEITFTDAPDFSGHFIGRDGAKHHIYGDIGTVSADAFFTNTISRMEEGDLWITVDERQQFIIEASYDIGETMSERIAALLGIE